MAYAGNISRGKWCNCPMAIVGVLLWGTTFFHSGGAFSEVRATRTTAAAPNNNQIISSTDNASGTQAGHTAASVQLIVMNTADAAPFGIKVGDTFIRIMDPREWPQPPRGANGRSTAPSTLSTVIVDTADLLRANGFPPDTPYSFVVGGAELNASNVYRIQGNREHHDVGGVGQGNDWVTEEYRYAQNENEIWRVLKFRNYTLSYAQAPSLRDHVVSSPSDVRGAEEAVRETITTGHDSISPEVGSEKAMAPLVLHNQIHRALTDPDPEVRAGSLEKAVAYFQEEANEILPNIAAALHDEDARVREASLDMLEGWDGPLPVQELTEMALGDGSAPLRAHALDLLVHSQGERSMSTLKQALRDPDPQVGQLALQLIDRLDDKEGEGAVTP